MHLKSALFLLFYFYAIVWAACTGVAVLSGGLGVFSAGLSVAALLAVPMCMSALAMCAVFLML